MQRTVISRPIVSNSAIDFIHNRGKREIQKDATWLSFACLVASLFVMSSIVMPGKILGFLEF